MPPQDCCYFYTYHLVWVYPPALHIEGKDTGWQATSGIGEPLLIIMHYILADVAEVATYWIQSATLMDETWCSGILRCAANFIILRVPKTLGPLQKEKEFYIYTIQCFYIAVHKPSNFKQQFSMPAIVKAQT